MENLKIKTLPGNVFGTVAENAKQLAIERNTNVEFDFNMVICIVSPETDLKLLYRDYSNSWTMEWQTVGPNCTDEYPLEIQIELEKRNKVNEEESAERTRQYEIEDAKQRAAFEEKTANVKMEFKSLTDWKLGRVKDTDDYGACIYDYAEAWAKLMQAEMIAGNELEEVAEKTSHELGFYGITGYMYGAAVTVLSQCWLYGERLRKWHNKEYKHEGDGVVNPAILTIG